MVEKLELIIGLLYTYDADVEEDIGVLGGTCIRLLHILVRLASPTHTLTLKIISHIPRTRS